MVEQGPGHSVFKCLSVVCQQHNVFEVLVHIQRWHSVFKVLVQFMNTICNVLVHPHPTWPRPPGLNDSLSGAMQLLPDPLYSIPTDNTYLLAVASTELGRIFLAGKDGCLYEIAYQAEAGWFSQRCRKINHSKSSLSFLVPSLLQFSFSEDGACGPCPLRVRHACRKYHTVMGSDVFQRFTALVCCIGNLEVLSSSGNPAFWSSCSVKTKE